MMDLVGTRTKICIYEKPAGIALMQRTRGITRATQFNPWLFDTAQAKAGY